MGEKKNAGRFYFESGCHDNTTPHNKKADTPLLVVLELGSRIFSNARLVLKLATLVIYYNSLNLASFSRGVTSGSDFFYRGLWSDISPSSHPPWVDINLSNFASFQIIDTTCKKEDR